MSDVNNASLVSANTGTVLKTPKELFELLSEAEKALDRVVYLFLAAFDKLEQEGTETGCKDE